MAKAMGFLCFALFLIHLTTPPFTHCRSITQISKTTMLDVTTSIEKTHKLFFLNPKPIEAILNQQAYQSISPSFPLTLQLHSRVSLIKPSQGDYKSLTLARLERDSARVRSLLAKLDQATKGIEQVDLKPDETGEEREFWAGGIEGPIISGTSQGSGEYFSQIGIGKPPTSAYMVLDTGSDINWVQCAPCADCYQQSDPIFEPAKSSSYSPLTCESPQCKSLDIAECHNGTCLYEVSYGDGSYTVGDFITETISIGSSLVDNIAIGCGHNNEGLFIGSAGLLGLGGGPLSFSSQLNASSFSYCLVDRDSDSSSTLEFNLPPPPNAVIASLLRNNQFDTFYYVGLSGISVGGQLLPIPESLFQMEANGMGGVIIDSGTAVSRLQTEMYELLRDAFIRGTKDLPPAKSVSLFDTCYDLSSRSSVEVPTVSFHFSKGKELVLPAKNYLIPVDSDGTFCFAFAPTASSLSIIGNVQQQETRVGFDLKNSLVWFNSCNC